MKDKFLSINNLKASIAKFKLKNSIADNCKIIIASNSMFPTLKRGDVVTIVPINRALKIGDIILYKHWEYSITVHRIVRILMDKNGEIKYQTQGDNNKMVDSYLVSETDIIGRIDVS